MDIMFIARFIIGGTVIALVPWVAQKFGPELAGILVLVPATSIVSTVFVYRSGDTTAVERMAAGGVIGLLALAAFFVCLSLTARYGLAPALAASIAGWLGGVWLLNHTSPDWRFASGVLIAAVIGFANRQRLTAKPENALAALIVSPMAVMGALGFTLLVLNCTWHWAPTTLITAGFVVSMALNHAISRRLIADEPATA